MTDLLKPRYKVIAQYPACPFNVGTILTEERKGVFKQSGRTETESNVLGISVLENCKANFNKLEWWEERSGAELPSYVRSGKTGIIHKVKNYLITENVAVRVSDKPIALNGTLPATEEEFLNQK